MAPWAPFSGTLFMPDFGPLGATAEVLLPDGRTIATVTRHSYAVELLQPVMSIVEAIVLAQVVRSHVKYARQSSD